MEDVLKTLLEHHVKDEERWLDEIRVELREIKKDVKELSTFKITLLAESKFASKWTSIIVSGVISLVGFIITTAVALYAIKVQLGQH